MAAVRYTADGELDPSFGSGGKKLFGYENNYANANLCKAAALQSDGKILMAGSVKAGSQIAVCRLLESGALDTSFSSDGWILWDVASGSGIESAESIAIQDDGRIVVSGGSGTVVSNGWDNSNDDYAIMRIRPLRWTASTPSLPSGTERWSRRFSMGPFAFHASSLMRTRMGMVSMILPRSSLAPACSIRIVMTTDCLQDGAEVSIYHSSPTSADSDSDGLTDYAEVMTHGTNPSRADSDGDGLSDPSEIQTHHTDPLDADMDDDGLNDGVEIAIGSSPINRDTDGGRPARQLPRSAAP